MNENDKIIFVICKLPSYSTSKCYYVAVCDEENADYRPTYLHPFGEIKPLGDINDLLYSTYDECIQEIESYFDIISETTTPRLYISSEAHE